MVKRLRCDGIGRRDGLKIRWWRHRVGSSPTTGTKQAPRCMGRRFWLSKKWLAPLFRGFHSSLAPTARPGSYAEKPLLRKAFADLPYTPPNPIIASGGQSRAPPVAGGARRKPSEQGSARKAPRADAARLLRTALRPPNPQRFFDRLSKAPSSGWGFAFPGLARPLHPAARGALPTTGIT